MKHQLAGYWYDLNEYPTLAALLTEINGIEDEDRCSDADHAAKIAWGLAWTGKGWRAAGPTRPLGKWYDLPDGA